MNETEAKLCVCEEESESQNERAEEKLQCGALQWPAALAFSCGINFGTYWLTEV